MDHPPVKRKRRHHTRSKLGCLTCRARRKRCSEEKPVCLGCQRNFLLCSWPSPPQRQTASSSSCSPPPASPAKRFECVTVRVEVEQDTITSDEASRHADADLGQAQDDENETNRDSDLSCFSPTSTFTLDVQEALTTLTASLSPYEYDYDHDFDYDYNHAHDHDRDDHKETLIPTLYRPPPSQLRTLTTPGAQQLFQHYVESTAFMLAARPFPGNPYVSCLLPLAVADDNIMHAVLATSGSHRACRDSDDSIYPQARQHYAVALRSAKHQITKFARGQCEEPSALITLLLMLCQFECVDGDLSGAAVHHLGAASEIFARAGISKTTMDTACHSFMVEQILYLSCVSKNVGLTLGQEEPSFMTFPIPSISLMELGADSGNNSNSNSVHGFMFGYAYELFMLIPEIQRLAFVEHRSPLRGQGTTLSAFEVIRTRLEQWLPPDETEDDSLRFAGIMYQQALLAFLYCAIHGPAKPSMLLLFQTAPIVQRFMECTDQVPLSSPVWTIMMWPFFTIGSCVRDGEQRERLAWMCDAVAHRMYATRSCIKILRWVWESDIDEAFGPYGAEKLMRQRKVRWSVG